MPRVERKIRNAISYSKTMPEEGKVKLTSKSLGGTNWVRGWVKTISGGLK